MEKEKIMNIRKKGIFIFIFIFGAFFYWFFYQNSWVPLSAKFEVNQMLQSHDTKRMRQVAADKKTRSYLLHLKKATHCDSVTDFQGGSENIGYYVADINGKGVGIYMQREILLFWRIKEIKLWVKFKKEHGFNNWELMLFDAEILVLLKFL